MLIGTRPLLILSITPPKVSSAAAPQPFNKDVVHPAAAAIHGDLDPGRRQRACEDGAGELRTLILLKISGLPWRAKASSSAGQAERDVHRVGETFFGEIRKPGGKASTLVEFCDFFYETYKNTSREKLLEWLASTPDIERLRTLPQEDLAIICVNAGLTPLSTHPPERLTD